jgi:hypothetical protein
MHDLNKDYGRRRGGGVKRLELCEGKKLLHNEETPLAQECVNLLGSICGSKVDIIRSIHPGDHLLAATA